MHKTTWTWDLPAALAIRLIKRMWRSFIFSLWCCFSNMNCSMHKTEFYECTASSIDCMQRISKSSTRHDWSILRSNWKCSHLAASWLRQDYCWMEAGRIPSRSNLSSFRIWANPSILLFLFLSSVDCVTWVARDNLLFLRAFSLAHSWSLTRLSLTGRHHGQHGGMYVLRSWEPREHHVRVLVRSRSKKLSLRSHQSFLWACC